MTTVSATPDTASDASQPKLAGWLDRHRFTLRRLHSLTGVIFGGYIVVHLLVNATLLQASFPWLFGNPQSIHDVYQGQVTQIHALPFLILIEWFFIYLPIIFHALYGIVIIAQGRPNSDRYTYAKNWAYTLQRVTSVILLFFILFHVLSMKGLFPGGLNDPLTFNPRFATQTTINHMHAAWWVGYLIYPIGILAATFHLANGFWTAGNTWGVTITASSQRLWGFVCLGLFIFTTACGLGSLGAALAAEPRDLGDVQETYQPANPGEAFGISGAAGEASEALEERRDGGNGD